jgi:hypothetical protein
MAAAEFVSRPPGEQADLARKFAPILVIHPADRWPPVDPTAFVNACELRFASAGGKAVVAAAGKIAPARLGTASKRTAYTRTAKEIGKPVTAWQLSRPFAKSDKRIAGLHGSSGFSLARTKPAKIVPLEQTPMLYEWRDDATLIYWFCMAGSALPQDLFKAILEATGLENGLHAISPVELEVIAGLPGVRSALLGLIDTDDLFEAQTTLATFDVHDEVHQGDWEGVTYKFKGKVPLSAGLHQHGRLVDVPLKSLKQVGGHAVMYCARGSHATVATPATSGAEEVAPDGPMWQPPPELVLDAKTQPWYGFGGSWGQAQLPPIGTLPSPVRALVQRIIKRDVWEEGTGPLGPSPYKTS